MSCTVIVTGAAGFIGSHLSRALLAEGHRVVGIDNFDAFYGRSRKEANVAGLRDAAPDEFELIEADICDSGAMDRAFALHRPSAVFHIAALAGVRPSLLDPARFATVNVGGLVNVLEAARVAECPHFVFASSSSVYGNCATVPFAETDDVSRPISPYAATKRSGELIGHSFAHLHGISFAALRFFTVYGPAQRPDLAISRFMGCVARDEEIPMFGDGTSSRDYTYVDDVIRGTLGAWRLLARADPGLFRIFNIGGSSPIMLADMIEAIGQVVGKTPRIKQLPMQPGDVDRTFADLSRSREELDYQPATGFHEGLRQQWAWLHGTLEHVREDGLGASQVSS